MTKAVLYLRVSTKEQHTDNQVKDERKRLRFQNAQVTPIKDLRAYHQLEQVERLIAATTNPKDALLVRIPWLTGIRVSELIGIRIQDIDFDDLAVFGKARKNEKLY